MKGIMLNFDLCSGRWVGEGIFCSFGGVVFAAVIDDYDFSAKRWLSKNAADASISRPIFLLSSSAGITIDKSIKFISKL
jgi:hypothetical protein